LGEEESPVLPGEEREEEGWARVESAGRERERAFPFQVPLKPTLPHGRADPGGSHPIMNKWERGMGSFQPGEGSGPIPRKST
jgi:hypothetical protein